MASVVLTLNGGLDTKLIYRPFSEKAVASKQSLTS